MAVLQLPCQALAGALLLLATSACGLVAEGEPTAASWCDEEGVGDVAEVMMTQQFSDGELIASQVELSDAGGRTLVTINEAIGTSAARRVEYERNAIGQVVETRVDDGDDGVIDHVTTTTYYEEGRRIVEAVDEGNDGTIDQVSTHEYSASQETWVYDTDNDGDPDWSWVATFTENGDILVEEYDQDGDGTVDRTVTNTYSDSGLLLSTTLDDVYGDGDGETTYEYDESGRLLRRVQTNNGPVALRLVEETYGYDDEGRLITVWTERNQDDGADTVEWRNYDSEGRLVRREIRDGLDTLVSQTAYEYGDGPDPVLVHSDGDGDGEPDVVYSWATCD